MSLQIALIVSVILQLLAFFITISLIPKTKFNVAWISISVGFLLMALRRAMELFSFFKHESFGVLTELNGWIAVVVSVAMLIASVYIRKIFELLNRLHGLRKENEAKLLSAIISTEEKERRHFAKELHDGLGPVLSSAKMTLSAINQAKMTPQNIDLLDKVSGLVDNAIVTAKEISGQLTPHILERYGLKKAIETFVRETNLKNTVQIDISTNINRNRYENNLEVIIYRICCELINNSLKYASANRISVMLSEFADNIELKYNDDGRGFDVEKSMNKGMGLTNIKSRVRSLNGFIEMRSTLGKGFYLEITLPK